MIKYDKQGANKVQNIDLAECQRCQFYSGRNLENDVFVWGSFCTARFYFFDESVAQIDELTSCPKISEDNTSSL